MTPIVPSHKRLFHVGSFQAHRRAILKEKKHHSDAQVLTNRAPSHELQTALGLRRNDSCIPAEGESDKATGRENMQVSVQMLRNQRYSEGKPTETGSFQT